jgi:chaperonin GroEL (HSP60 family)
MNIAIQANMNHVFRELDRLFCCSQQTLVSTKETIRVQTRFQTLFGYRFEDITSSLIHQVVMTHTLRAESLGPGAFEECIQMLLDLWKGKTTLESLRSVLGHIENVGTRSARHSDLQNILTSLPVKLRDMVSIALDLCGFGGRIFVEKSNASEASVELITGFTFGLKPLFPVEANLVEPRVACIDGFIESVAEIHALLTSLVESKSTALLFVRGLHDDVRQTLRVNHDRGILKVYPFIVPFDLEGINTLADLATVSGGDVTSSHKGQLISLLTIADLPVIEKASVFKDRVVLINSSSRRRVQAHVNHLKEKRSTYSDESLTRLIDLRIRALSPNQVMIRLPNNERYAVDAQAIDQTLRNVRSIVEHGMIGSKPAATQAASVVHAIKCWESLQSLGSIVTL